MSYRLKGATVILEGDINKIVPRALPVSPTDGEFLVDSADKKLKVWNAAESRWIILGEASDLKFRSTTTTPVQNNGFVSNNAQAAIEEAKNIALSKSRFTIVCTFNSSVGNNNWLGYSELMPGNQVPIRLPIKCRLREISFSYARSSLLGIPIGSDQVDGQFKLFKNGLTDPTDVVHTEQFTNQAGGKQVTGLSLDFNAGDFMVGRWIDQGDNPSDLAIVYYFEPRE